MAETRTEKRKRDDVAGGSNPKHDEKRRKRGFVVGPDNLPDGSYKRKNQKIKRDLIGKAKIKKDYAKIKRQAQFSEKESLPQPASLALDDEQPSSTEPHPDRQTMIAREEQNEGEEGVEEKVQRPRHRKPKTAPFQKEYQQAQQRKAEAEERRKAREEAEKERQRKIEERERFRKAMAKARTGGPNGQRKLGRESTVLLEKVKRMVGGAG